MKIIFIGLCIIMAFISKGYSQSKSIYISGTIDSSILQTFRSDTLFVKEFDPERKLLNNQSIFKVPLYSGGTFIFKIPSRSGKVYLSFSMSKKDGIGNIISINYLTRFFYLDEWYLFENGDNVKINFKKEGQISFQGKGADKLKCQFNMYNLNTNSPSITSTIIRLLNQSEYSEALASEGEAVDFGIKMRLKILNSFRQKLNKEVYNILYLDAISYSEYQTIYPLWNKTLNPKNDESVKAQKAVQDYFLKSRMTNYLNDENTPFIYESGYFTEYLFENEWNLYKLFTTKPLTGRSFIDIYSIIDRKYQGELRSRLLIICLRKLNVYFSHEIIANAEKIKNDFKGTGFESTINTWINKLRMAYPFEFEDASGKVHRLNDFKGKVIVLDIWFTGCLPCMKLNKGMHEIIKNYKNRKDIVFITVSQDRNKEKWLESLRSGQYTSYGTINLYTNGLGASHPMMKFYNFNSAPQLIIINKDGRLVTTSPPIPLDGITTELLNGKYVFNSSRSLQSPKSREFMKLLNDLLH